MLKQGVIVLAALLCLLSCGNKTEPATDSKQQNSAATPAVSPKSSQQNRKTVLPPAALLSEHRDWQQIKQLGVIRALKLNWEQPNSLPRSGVTSRFHIELFNQFAQQHKLTVQWINVANLNEMFDLLRQHKADIIPRHLSITTQRLQTISFSQPLVLDRELLVAAAATVKPNSQQEITVHLPQGSAYIESVSQHFPTWKIEIIKDNLNQEELANALLEQRYKYSVLDKSSYQTLRSYRHDLQALLTLPGTRKLAWAVSQNNDSLLDQLNAFISVHHISINMAQARTLDLKQMQLQNLPLRVITRNSPETYFMWRGELVGFEYELMREFAKRHQLRLEVIVAQSYQEMVQLLEQGKGDVIAAALSKTDSRAKQLTMSKKYNMVSEKLVSHKNSKPIKQWLDLKGRSISIRKSSAFWPTAQQLAQQYGALLIAADEALSTELLIAQVANKEIDLTIADSNLLAIEQQFRAEIISPLTLKEGIPYAYAVRNNNQQLLMALNSFVKKEYRQLFFNIVKNKYFSNTKKKKQYRAKRIQANSNLSPYDDMVKAKAREYQFDWRLITAQMYQESRFNPKARSSAGAQGLMQVLPRTGKEMGFTDLTNPQQSIAAGIQYLDWSRARFSKDLPLQEQVYFSLAAYNAGFGHVKDAQRLAKQMNLRSDKWFNNVETAMLLLQQPKYYKKTRFGYCRGSEPVNYVRQIQQRYLSYVEIVQ